MKNIQDYLRHFLQTVPTSKMLQLLLCIDATFEYLSKAQIIRQRRLSKSYVASPQFTY